MGRVCAPCRIWEIIDGKADTVLADLGEEVQSDLIEAIELKNADGITAPLSKSKLILILSDFKAGIACIQFGFSVRLAWNKSLLWLLLGVARVKSELARHWAERCCRIFDQSAPGDHRHHPKALL